MLGGQDEGLQMTKDEVLLMARKALGNARDFIYLGDASKPPWDETSQVDELNDALVAIKAALEAKDESERTGQPYYWQLDAINSAINMERENCARLCDAYELPDVAHAIRTRSHR